MPSAEKWILGQLSCTLKENKKLWYPSGACQKSSYIPPTNSWFCLHSASNHTDCNHLRKTIHLSFFNTVSKDACFRIEWHYLKIYNVRFDFFFKLITTLYETWGRNEGLLGINRLIKIKHWKKKQQPQGQEKKPSGSDMFNHANPLSALAELGHGIISGLKYHFSNGPQPFSISHIFPVF